MNNDYLIDEDQMRSLGESILRCFDPAARNHQVVELHAAPALLQVFDDLCIALPGAYATALVTLERRSFSSFDSTERPSHASIEMRGFNGAVSVFELELADPTELLHTLLAAGNATIKAQHESFFTGHPLLDSAKVQHCAIETARLAAAHTAKNSQAFEHA
jgi:hypothetical protein